MVASSILDANGAWSRGAGAEASVEASRLASRLCVEYSVEYSVELVEARAQGARPDGGTHRVVRHVQHGTVAWHARCSMALQLNGVPLPGANVRQVVLVQPQQESCSSWCLVHAHGLPYGSAHYWRALACPIGDGERSYFVVLGKSGGAAAASCDASLPAKHVEYCRLSCRVVWRRVWLQMLTVKYGVWLINPPSGWIAKQIRFVETFFAHTPHATVLPESWAHSYSTGRYMHNLNAQD